MFGKDFWKWVAMILEILKLIEGAFGPEGVAKLQEMAASKAAEP